MLLLAVVRTIVAEVGQGFHDRASLLIHVLRQATLWRLIESGVRLEEAEVLVGPDANWVTPGSSTRRWHPVRSSTT
jgi:hypothetical protein